jgi:hypothetical protein
VDGGDDLLGVDALEVDRCFSEFGIAELALRSPPRQSTTINARNRQP